MAKEENFRVSVYIPKKLHALIKRESEKQNRSVSNLVTVILTKQFGNKD